MTPNSRWLALPAAIAAMGVLGPLSAQAAPTTHNCRSVTVTIHGAKGTAHGIRSTGLGCSRARTVVRACLRDALHGWTVRTAPSPDDTDPHGMLVLDRRSAHVVFEVRGRGGCA